MFSCFLRELVVSYNPALRLFEYKITKRQALSTQIGHKITSYCHFSHFGALQGGKLM